MRRIGLPDRRLLSVTIGAVTGVPPAPPWVSWSIASATVTVRRLRPLAQSVLDAMLAQAMAQYAQDALGDHLTLLADRQVLDQPGRTA